MGRWDFPEPVFDCIVEDAITITVHNGILTNFLGGLAAKKSPEFISSMLHHFLNSLATGIHTALDGFQICGFYFRNTPPESHVVVRVQNDGSDEWHTHIISCIGKPTKRDGTLVFEGE